MTTDRLAALLAEVTTRANAVVREQDAIDFIDWCRDDLPTAAQGVTVGLDVERGPRSMESVRNWMGLDVWQSLGHDFADWSGWNADVWADMMAEVRAALATPQPADPNMGDPDWTVDCGIASCPFRGVPHVGHAETVSPGNGSAAPDLLALKPCEFVRDGGQRWCLTHGARNASLCQQPAPDLRAAAMAVYRKAWYRDGEEVATVPLTLMDMLGAALATSQPAERFRLPDDPKPTRCEDHEDGYHLTHEAAEECSAETYGEQGFLDYENATPQPAEEEKQRRYDERIGRIRAALGDEPQEAR